MEKKLANLKPIKRNFSDNTTIYPSRFKHYIRENWFLLIGLTLAISLLVIALFVGLERYKLTNFNQKSLENAPQSKGGIPSLVPSKNTDRKNLNSISTQSELAPKGESGDKTDTTQNEQ
jgi:hypothetical protein